MKKVEKKSPFEEEFRNTLKKLQEEEESKKLDNFYSTYMGRKNSPDKLVTHHHSIDASGKYDYINHGQLSSLQNSYGAIAATNAVYQASASLSLSADIFEIRDANNESIFTYNLQNGYLQFNPNKHIDEASKLFWECMLKSNHTLVPIKKLEEVGKKKELVELELFKTKELLNKALKQLAIQFNKDNSEDAEEN